METNGAKEESLSWRVVLAYGSGGFGYTILSLSLVSWILYFYAPPEGKGPIIISAGVIGAVRLVERIGGAIFEPLVGYFSDRTRSRWGRRLPWIFVGAPVFCVSYAAIWFPPSGRPTNDPLVVVYFAICLTAFWFAFTAVVAPYLALLPEISRTAKGRLRLSVWVAVYEVIGNIVGSVGAGQLAALGAITLLGVGFASGYELMGVIGAILAGLTFLFIVSSVREPEREEHHEVRFSIKEAVIESLKNPQFLPYAGGVGGIKMASTCAVVGVPYLATELMGVGEAMAGNMLAIIIVIATLAFPLVQRLSERFGKARVYRWGAYVSLVTYPLMGTIGLISVLPPVAHGVLLFACAGFPVACLMVLPRALLADVIDVDEERTGYRREAMYNGMGGVVEKAGEALAFGAVGVLFEAFGNSASNPLGLRLLGLAAAAGVGMALLAFRRYSIET